MAWWSDLPKSPSALVESIHSLFVRRQFVRYVLVGIGNTAFSFGVYAAALSMGLDYKSASLISLLLGILFSFTTQGRIVFGNATLATFMRFVVAWAVIYLVNIAIIALLMKIALNAYWAGAVATVPVTLLSYFILRTLVFGRGSAGRP